MIYKRGKFWWYRFMWDGRLIRESTRQGNDKIARNMESAHRTALAKGEVGIREKKAAPTLAEFCDKRFEPWAKATFEKACRNNWHWFRAGIRRLKAYEPLAKARLDEVTNEKVAGFAAFEQTRLLRRGRDPKAERHGLAVSSVNSAVRVLRRALRLAVEWGLIESVPRLGLLPGERHRERVVSQTEEALYLLAASPLMADVATVLADTGMRPDECYRLRWEDVTWVNGRNGSLLVTHGKTAAARRPLPMTPRVRAVLEARWEAAGRPAEGWVWPAPTQGRPHQPCQPQEAAHESADAGKAAAIRPVRPSAHVPDAAGGVGLRCLDPGADRRAQLNRHFQPVRSPVRGCGPDRPLAPGWAQNWAQRRKPRIA